MQEIVFTIKGDSIQLIQLLKATGLADSGGEAKTMVESQKVMLNGQLELRKRAQLKAGDKVSIGTNVIIVS